MKNKIITLILSVIAICSLSACGNTDSTNNTISNNQQIVDSIQNTDENKQNTDENKQNTDENKQNTDENKQNTSYEIEIIDCGQADSILITGNNIAVLIDAGEDRDAHDIKEALDQHNIETIDLLVGTHPHADHIGGMQEIVENYNIEDILMYPTGHSTKLYTNLLNSIDEKGYSITQAEVGDVYTVDNLDFTVISPSHEFDDPNNCSVVLNLTYNNFSMLFTGDAETQAESEYTQYVTDVDILKSGHHGSITSSSEELLNKALPEVAVISCGLNNKYGHPDPETLEKYKNHNIEVFRTDESGNLYIITDGNDYEIYTEKDGYTISNNDTTKNENYIQDTIIDNNTDNLNDSEESVYITKSGSKYHSTSSCPSLSNSNSISEIAENEAQSRGLEKCAKCWK